MSATTESANRDYRRTKTPPDPREHAQYPVLRSPTPPPARHSAAVAWLEAGARIKAVSDLLGHSSISVTGDVYGHTFDDAARAAIEGLTGHSAYDKHAPCSPLD